MWALRASIRSPIPVTDWRCAARNAIRQAGLTDARSPACQRSYWSRYSCAYVRASWRTRSGRSNKPGVPVASTSARVIVTYASLNTASCEQPSAPVRRLSSAASSSMQAGSPAGQITGGTAGR